ncbi:adenylate cyclase type 10-like [Gopherus flavomarginatus]|uniref:adenylate cyclase type 10-like n=1 Tax=Gopherus flavomarginatus TaxID=286002 RepID=UPI0021CC48F9|nr:adenylate cyclase type 10-like [Gopherus flavomarginatus]
MGVLKETSQEMGKKEVKVSFPPRQVQVVALLPDLLVYNNHSLLCMLPSMETFNGVLLCVEITGLTALLEKLYTNNDLNCGTEQLTQMLNDYIEGIMEHVLCFGGDILNSTGDALLVLWKVERSQLSDIITLAAKCSLEMQEQFGFSYTEVGLQLQLKIGMSAGHMSQLIVGDEIRQHLLVTGQQVDDVRLAQSLAQAREVILSPNCWELCDQDVLETEMLKGQKAMKIGRLLHARGTAVERRAGGTGKKGEKQGQVLLREAVALAFSHELELALRRFALGNVLKKGNSTKVDIQESFYAIRSLMAIVFGIDACRPYKRQDILQNKLTGLWEETFYCVFNNQFLVKAAEEATLIFIIDEAQYMDAASWDFLAKLLSSVPIFIVLSLSPFASKELLPCASAQGIMKSPKTAGVVLQELEPSKLLEMAPSAIKSIPYRAPIVSSKEDTELYICTTRKDVDLDAFPLPVRLKELLLYILPEWTNKKMEETLMSLINFHVFECFGKEARATQAVGSCHLRTHLGPLTMQTLGPEESEDNLQCRAKSVMNKQVLPDDHLRVEQEFLDRVDKMIKYHKRGKEEATNLAPCECGERVESVVSALACHCLMVNDRTRAFYYLLESVAASLHLSNNYMNCVLWAGGGPVSHRISLCLLEAYLYLKKASGLQELSALAVFPCLKRPKLKINQFEEATFCSLRGEVCFNMGQIALAKKLIKRALCLLHKGFPRTWLGAFFQSLLEESKHSVYHTQQRQAQHTDGKALAVLQQQIHCLSLFWQLYSLDSTANRKYSRLAALMEINLANASENKMQIISTYMDFSQFSQSMGYKDEWLKYEMMTIQRSSQCNFTFTRERLLMTAQLAQALVYSKLYLGHLTRSIQLGFQAHTMCVCLRKTSLHCLVLSVLFKSAFLKNKCVRVLEWLWELSTQEESIIVLACFYSVCLDLLLCDAGFDYRPIEECLQFINQYEASCILKSQSNILLSLYSSLAIWFGRLQHWDLFEDNFTKAQWLVSRTNASLFGTRGFFRFLECQGLLLRRVMEDMPKKVRETRSSTLRYFEEFLSRCSTSLVYHTRVYSLKASVNLLGDEDKSQVPLSKGLKLSATSHNRLEETSLSVSPDSVQNKNQGSGRVEELKDSKDQDEEGTREYMKSVTSRLKSEPRVEELTFVHLQLGQTPASPTHAAHW